MMNQLWPWLLSAVGITGIWLAGSHRTIGWIFGVAAQFLWITYAVLTSQWGFIASALAYTFVYSRNWIKWDRERASHLRYQAALAHGLSDHEAREEGWPTLPPPALVPQETIMTFTHSSSSDRAQNFPAPIGPCVHCNIPVKGLRIAGSVYDYACEPCLRLIDEDFASFIKQLLNGEDLPPPDAQEHP